MINHLTHTGQYVGVTYCGAFKQASDNCAHMPIKVRTKDMVQWTKEHVSCKGCLDVVIDLDAELAE